MPHKEKIFIQNIFLMRTVWTELLCHGNLGLTLGDTMM